MTKSPSPNSEITLLLRPHVVKRESSALEQNSSIPVATPSSATRQTAALLLRLRDRVVDSADDDEYLEPEEDVPMEDELEQDELSAEDEQENPVEPESNEFPGIEDLGSRLAQSRIVTNPVPPATPARQSSDELQEVGYLTPYVASAKSKKVAVGDRVEISPSSVTVSNGTVTVSHGSTVTRFHDVRVRASPHLSRGQLALWTGMLALLKDPDLVLAEVDVEDRCDGCRNIQTKFLPPTVKKMSCMAPLFVAPDDSIHIGGKCYYCQLTARPCSLASSGKHGSRSAPKITYPFHRSMFRGFQVLGGILVSMVDDGNTSLSQLGVTGLKELTRMAKDLDRSKMVPGMFEEADDVLAVSKKRLPIPRYHWRYRPVRHPSDSEYTDEDRPSNPSDVESDDVFVEHDRSTKGKGKEKAAVRPQKGKKGKAVERKRKRAVEDEEEEQEEVQRVLRPRRSKAILRSSLVTPPIDEGEEEWEPDFETSGDEDEEHAGPSTREARKSRLERSKRGTGRR
ncbi:hypothetical protein TREMEDRAFT_63673 [Tremella mesenterica DSM 1558]|uniref:uncharacterized protein n=1 Tax=Tremella mesenterica (strain ATCC 24925 / CBS 8224 / DSM 1558 / NBRC 9311 / NRRL Y-6157 / RJB 2259-6 / UBC 559-6) TaxID=578456 RepID=UPI0003F48EFC|nr:uncharacterized protein TREMEDRAFT_63673 [Tremella mesenterica DSM 1558]EIW68501.1 hypothetical protein TREMEDRAFT_63673 [Tremella mesenterica DSM 1558]